MRVSLAKLEPRAVVHLPLTKRLILTRIASIVRFLCRQQQRRKGNLRIQRGRPEDRDAESRTASTSCLARSSAAILVRIVNLPEFNECCAVSMVIQRLSS